METKTLISNCINRKFAITCFSKRLYNFYQKFTKIQDFQLIVINGTHFRNYYIDSKEQITYDSIYCNDIKDYTDIKYYFDKENNTFILY
jgi:hypothetical protein